MSFLLSAARSGSRSSSATTTLASARAFSSSRTHSLARMTIVGRVGVEPEVNELADGRRVIRHIVGSESGPRDNRVLSWFRVSSFVAPDAGRKGDYLMGIGKGTLVYVEGDASMRLTESTDGKKTANLNIVQTKIDVLKRPNPIVSPEQSGGEA